MRAFIYTMNIEEALFELGTDADTGLTSETAASRLAAYKEKETQPAGKRFGIPGLRDQFRDISKLALLIAVVITAVISTELLNIIIVASALLIHAIYSAVSKNRASRVLRILRDERRYNAYVRRDGEVKIINRDDIVIGDILLFSRGDIISADVRLIEAFGLTVDESSVTGEARAEKDPGTVFDSNTPPGGCSNIAYKGSTVIKGRGAGVVYNRGIGTEQDKNTEIYTGNGFVRTALLDNINSTSKSLGVICIIICILMFVTGLLYGIFEIGYEIEITELIVITLALIVVSVPGEMTAMAMYSMTGGVQKMAKAGIIAKDLNSALNIGTSEIICISKTGILTQDKMTVTRVADCDTVYEVTGVGYKSKGFVAAEIMITRNIALMSEIVVLCNNSFYDKETFEIAGDPTECAMLVFGVKLGLEKPVLEKMRPRISEIPFDTTRKMMSTYNLDGDRVIMYTKGAAEEIINRSTYVYLDGEIAFMSEAVRVKLLIQANNFADQALRVMACAYKVYNSTEDIDNSEGELIYVGMMGISDPLCEEAGMSLQQCRNAGINVKMITGDHRGTAAAIAYTYGMIDTDEEVIKGDDAASLTDEELVEHIKSVNVFARVTPGDKQRIISALKSDGRPVTMTGDDLDDVPAIIGADIGVAMGEHCCDAVIKAADLILQHNNLGKLLNAVERSKIIYMNISKIITHIFTCKVSVLLLILISVACGLSLPLTANMLLLSFLLVSTVTTQAIGMESKETPALSRKPGKRNESVINRKTAGAGLTRGIILFAGVFIAYIYGTFVAIVQEGSSQHILAMSMCFFTLTAGELLLSFSSKTEGFIIGKNMFRNRLLNIAVIISLLLLFAVIYIPGVNTLFTLYPLSAGEMSVCLLLILLMITGVEVSKRSIH